MNLHYFFDHKNNFGDALNTWLWDALLADRKMNATDIWLCGIGTILNHNLPPDKPMVIMGSGIGYGPTPIDRGRNWDVAAVRGPLSAHCLGLDQEKAITDGAILLSLLPEYAPKAATQSRSGTLFIPHYMSVEGSAWAQACALAGIEFVDPRSDSRQIMVKIQSAELVIADAMHGAIVADVLRTPWVAASFDMRTNSFKWNDWCLSMQIRHRPHGLPASTLFEVVRNMAMPLNGDRMPLAAQGIEALSRQHRRNNRAKGTSIVFQYCKIANRVISDIATHVGALEQRFAPLASHRRIVEAANALHKLAGAPAMLSDDTVFHMQRERMANALKGLAERYGVALHKDLPL